MTWLHKGKPVDPDSDVVHRSCGFVYLITNLKTGRRYVGKKLFWSWKKYPPLKGRIKSRRKWTPTNWETYWSSCDGLLKDIKKLGEQNFKREIISFHDNKTEVNYAELCEQIFRNVLQDNYYNKNILTIYYPSIEFGGERIKEHLRRLRENNI